MTTNIGDGIAVGDFKGFPSSLSTRAIYQHGAGVIEQPVVIAFDGTPILGVANSLVASAIINGAATVRAGTGVTAGKDAAGNTIYTFDVPRAIIVTGNTSGTSVTFTVVGYDRYGRPMSEAITGPTTSTATGLKAFASVRTITTSGTTTSAFTVGSSNVIGLYYYLASGNYLLTHFFNGATDAGTVTVGDATSPATTTTGDALGTYAPAGTLDGTKRLTVIQLLTPTQVAATGQQPTAVYGITPV